MWSKIIINQRKNKKKEIIKKVEEKQQRLVFLNKFCFSGELFRKVLLRIFGLNIKTIRRILSFKGYTMKERINQDLDFFYDLEKRMGYIMIEKQLKRKISKKYLIEKDLNGFIFMRRKVGYPVNGQRTHANGKTPKKKSWMLWVGNK